MYSESAGTRKTLGDVDVVFDNGIFHLFHLVLPNHDYVAHAVSNNGFDWRRVENAIVIGDPGSWDDSMLWTVHVSRNPHLADGWRMFYTGLSRRDHGLKQRIGLAESDDLYRWRKAAVWWTDNRSALPYDLPGRPSQPPFDHDAASCFPLEPDAKHYESKIDEARNWVSFRDPYFYSEAGRGWLVMSARVNQGPVTRRGCVAVAEETSRDQFETRPPLFHPGLYDDIEVPNLFRIDGEYYLIGSLREDAKIRYWHTTAIGKPWRSYTDNVVMASGNYAGRVMRDDRGWLLWNFYTADSSNRETANLLPPPKRLTRLPSGQLQVRSFEGFDDQVDHDTKTPNAGPLRAMRSDDQCVEDRNGFELTTVSGIESFVFSSDAPDLRMRATLTMKDEGKCGIVLRANRSTHDGYYISLDLFKGVAQVKSWDSGPDGSGEHMMQFRTLQQNFWECNQRGTANLCVINQGSYLEVSVEGFVLLSLADQKHQAGAAGFYVESATLLVSDLHVETLKNPVQSDSHLSTG